MIISGNNVGDYLCFIAGPMNFNVLDDIFFSEPEMKTLRGLCQKP